MSKTVAFKVPPPKLAATAEKWIAGRDSPDRGEGASLPAIAEVVKPSKIAKEKTTRFTLDVSEELHRRIKVACAERGQTIAEVMRDVLEREFPGKS